MNITLNPGESLTISLAETDGEFEVHFNTKQHPNAVVVKETAGLVSGKTAILYNGQFDPPAHDGDEPGVFDDPHMLEPEHAPNVVRSPHAGFFIDGDGVAQSTQLVRCQVKDDDDGLFSDDRLVLTLDRKGFVIGEFTFYKTMDDLEKVLGTRVPQIILGTEAPTNGAVPYGYFLDGHNRIHHTSSVQCRVIPNDLDPEEYVVQLLGVDDVVMGTYDLYQTRVEVEAAQSAK